MLARLRVSIHSPLYLHDERCVNVQEWHHSSQDLFGHSYRAVNMWSIKHRFSPSLLLPLKTCWRLQRGRSQCNLPLIYLLYCLFIQRADDKKRNMCESSLRIKIERMNMATRSESASPNRQKRFYRGELREYERFLAPIARSF